MPPPGGTLLIGRPSWQREMYERAAQMAWLLHTTPEAVMVRLLVDPKGLIPDLERVRQRALEEDSLYGR